MAENDNPQQFSLRWNNFHANLSSGFSALLQEEDLVDVTIAVEGRFVQAHKVVLSICSPYFKELFKINPCKHPIVILKDVSYKEMKGLLQFMYEGEVSISQEQLPDFLRAAELLHVKGLTSSDSEGSKANKKFTKVKPLKRALPPLKKERLEDSPPIHSSNHSIKDSSGDRFKDIPDLNSLPSEPTPGGSSLEFYKPKQEPPDYAESDSVGPDNIQMFSESETLEQDVQNISRLPSPAVNNLTTTETSDIQGGFQMTSRGRLQLVRNGFVYHCNRQTEDKIFWKCAEYNRTRCRSRCISVGGSVTVTHANHNHQLVRRNLGMPLPQQTAPASSPPLPRPWSIQQPHSSPTP